VNFFAIVTIFAQFTSIHEIEYNQHINEAHWTPILTIPLQSTLTHRPTGGMLKNYYGYLPYWIDTIYYQYFQMDLLSHIAYFSVEIDPATGSLGFIPNQNHFLKIINDAHVAGVSVHMTFIIFGSSYVSNFLNNSAARDSAIHAMSNFISSYGIDGINIDFEFVTSSVRDSFNVFVDGLATSLWNHPDGRKELYLATIAVPEWYPGYELVFLSNHSDGLFIMGYDFHWSGSSIAGPVSPCIPSVFWGEYCVAKSIGSYKSLGVDGSKIILGLPYYGYDWPTVSGDSGSATTGTGTGVIYFYAFQNANTHGLLWDEYSLTPWYKYFVPEWHQCWFDDSVSLDIKFGMVNDSLLQGAGCWALGYDRTYDHLWNTIRRNFWDSTSVAEYIDIPATHSVLFPTIFTKALVLYLPSTAASYEISLYDITGRKLIHIQSPANRTVVIGNHIRAGIYFLLVESERESYRHKIIKIQ
jgi:spore germination protein